MTNTDAQSISNVEMHLSPHVCNLTMLHHQVMIQRSKFSIFPKEELCISRHLCLVWGIKHGCQGHQILSSTWSCENSSFYVKAIKRCLRGSVKKLSCCLQKRSNIIQLFIYLSSLSGVINVSVSSWKTVSCCLSILDTPGCGTSQISLVGGAFFPL